MTLGTLVRARRLQLGLRADDVARKVGSSLAALTRLERNELRRSVPDVLIQRIADALDMNVEELRRANRPPQSSGGASEKRTTAKLAWTGEGASDTPSALPDDPMVAARLRLEFEAIARDLIEWCWNVRRSTFTPELARVIPLLAAVRQLLAYADSDAQASASILAGSALFVHGKAVGVTYSEDPASLVESLDQLALAEDLLSGSAKQLASMASPSLEDIWARAWALRELGSFYDLLAVQSLASDGEALLFKAVAYFGDRIATAIPEGSEVEVDLAVPSVSDSIKLLRLSFARICASKSFEAYLSSERLINEWLRSQRDLEHRLDQRLLIARMEMDCANTKRDRLLFAETLRNWLLSFGAEARLGTDATSGTLLECEQQFRASIVSLRDLVRDLSGADRVKGFKMLARLHFDLAYLIRVRSDHRRFYEALWNHTLAGHLDPELDSSTNQHSAWLRAQLENSLRDTELADALAKTEGYRQRSDVQALAYEF